MADHFVRITPTRRRIVQPRQVGGGLRDHPFEDGLDLVLARPQAATVDLVHALKFVGCGVRG